MLHLTRCRVLALLAAIGAICFGFALALAPARAEPSSLSVVACRTVAAVDVLVLNRQAGVPLYRSIEAANRGSMDPSCTIAARWYVDYGPPVRRVVLEGHIWEVRAIELPFIDFGTARVRVEPRVALIRAPAYRI